MAVTLAETGELTAALMSAGPIVSHKTKDKHALSKNSNGNVNMDTGRLQIREDV